jgi:transglutaminase-like putative cysteine protease
MRFLFLLCFSIIFHVFSFSQDYPKLLFGKANLEELLSKRCDQDSTAEAEMLYDKETIEFFVNNNDYYSIKIIYHGRIKIYKKSGLDRGIIKITCSKRNGMEESIENVKGFTYNFEDGKEVVSPLTSTSVFKEKVNDYESITKITAPQLKEGSVFEYTYTRIIPFPVSNKPNTWFFQGNIPYKWSELSVVIPGRFFYKLFYHGYIPFYINETKDTTQLFGDNLVKAIKYHFVIKNAPAFISETNMTTYKDYVAKLEFELASYTPPYGGEERRFTETWKDINHSLLEDGNFGEKLTKTGFLKDIASQFESITDTSEKVKAAFEYVSKIMKWNGYYHVYTSENLNKAFENKTGSGAQINMILVALLRRLKIEANPAIISTKGNGEINEAFPLLNKFNFTIAQAKVGGKDILMDATEKFSKPNMLPYHSLSTKVFIIEKDSGRLIAYKTKDKKSEMETIDYIIDIGSNDIKGKYTSSYGGYKALNGRNYLEKMGEEQERKNLKLNNPDWQLENIRIENKDSVYEPLKISYDFSVSNYSQTGDVIFFNPFYTHKYSENQFKTATRIYPVDFDVPTEDVTLITIKIPQGYKIEDQPTSGVFVLPDKSGKYSYVVELENDILKIRSHLTLSKSLFLPKEYLNLKELYNIVADKQAQQVILKKL